MLSVGCDKHSLASHCSGRNQCIHLTCGLTRLSMFTFYSSNDIGAFKIERNYPNPDKPEIQSGAKHSSAPSVP